MTDKLNPKYFVISGFKRDEKGIIQVDDEWRQIMKNCNDMIDPKKNPPNKKVKNG